jgi:hypothetical protein
MFVGWDWASTTHDITVIDATGADPFLSSR